MIDAGASKVEQAITCSNETDAERSREEICLVFFGRGSSDPDANSNILKVESQIRALTNLDWVETGFSGVTFPLDDICLEHLARLDFKRNVVFPYFLFSWVSIDRIYGFTDMVAARHPSIQFLKTDYLNDCLTSAPMGQIEAFA